MREWFTDDEPEPDCRCRTERERATLTVDAADCPGDGRLSESPDCRATVVAALGHGDVDSVVTTSEGLERAYLDADAALLVAAGRFATRVAATDERLAERARRDPLAAATEATGRAGHIADLAAETGLAVAAEESRPSARLTRTSAQRSATLASPPVPRLGGTQGPPNRRDRGDRPPVRDAVWGTGQLPRPPAGTRVRRGDDGGTGRGRRPAGDGDRRAGRPRGRRRASRRRRRDGDPAGERPPKTHRGARHPRGRLRRPACLGRVRDGPRR